MDLSVKIYTYTKGFPKGELFGLTSQMRRSAVSIPSNIIVEGAGRNSNKEFSQFIGIAKGSLFELETQIILSSRIGYLQNEQLSDLENDSKAIHKMLYGLQKSLNKD
ncbi:four helix bundle protein [Fulvitalea axinellae]|uniref:Four helix bundle protein n=2 Tax=Fulvitalea axinellae TaxID=1182444 RepID=A0AAU9CLW7_9BACT|nr:four helix bundle protein [Fulvitalea axinellae]